jgi:hypothetical protein
MCAFLGLPGCPEPGGSGRARACRTQEGMRKTRHLRPAPTADHSNPTKASHKLCIQEKPLPKKYATLYIEIFFDKFLGIIFPIFSLISILHVSTAILNLPIDPQETLGTVLRIFKAVVLRQLYLLVFC